MKKIVLAAALAALVFTSCNQSEPYVLDEQPEISFKAFSPMATKTLLSGTLTSQDIGAFAVYQSSESGSWQRYFFNSQFAYNSTSKAFLGSTARYWPLSGNLKVIAYSPYNVGTVAEPATDLGQLSITGIDNYTAQKDILFTKTAATQACSNKASMALSMAHALANVNVAFKTNVAGVKITKVTLGKANYKGDLSIKKNTSDANYTATWSNASYGTNATKDFAITGSSLSLTASASSFASCSSDGLMVVPGSASGCTLAIEYTIPSDNGTAIAQTASLSLSDTWQAGKKTIYNVSITQTEISFTVSADTWSSVESSQSL